jgi:hypothetical protein
MDERVVEMLQRAVARVQAERDAENDRGRVRALSVAITHLETALLWMAYAKQLPSTR